MDEPSRYFVPDVDGTNAITVIGETTVVAVILTPVGLLAIPTSRTGLRRIGFRDKLHLDAIGFTLVLYLLRDFAEAPLMQLLVRLLAIVDALTNSREVSEYLRLRLNAVGDKLRCDFVPTITDLRIDTGKCGTFGRYELLPASRPAFAPGKLGSERSLSLLKSESIMNDKETMFVEPPQMSFSHGIEAAMDPFGNGLKM